ncbi:MAG: hypothetical protein JNL01_04360 [Bdellovibrionales bacterium]|nr:hypothetical protein [Bdellovibrionales bacterium]
MMKKKTLGILGTLFIVLTATANAAIQQSNVDQIRRRLLRHSDRDLSKLISEVRIQMGESAYDPLLKIATSPDETERNRYMAISLLSEIGGKKSIPVLTRLTLDPSILTKLSSIRNLEKLDPEAALRAAARFRKDPTLIVRLEGLRVMRKSKSPTAE